MRRSITRPAVRTLCGLALWALAVPALAVPERVIELQGTSNTRDIDGYPTADGRIVQYGHILRSDKLSRLTAEGFAELEALRVDRQTIMDEYLLTNELSRAAGKSELMAKSRRDNGSRRAGRVPDAEAWFPLIGVKPEMLETYWNHVDKRYGSMDAYLAELGVGPAERDLLAGQLTVGKQDLAMGE